MKKFRKALAVLLSVLFVAGCFAACSSSSSETNDAAVKEIKDGKLTIGITIYEPMNYYDENDSTKLIGFDTEFAEAVCAKLGVEAEFVEINWDTKFNELNSGSIDCVWNGMTITDEAKTAASISTPYARNAQVVVMSADALDKYPTVESIADLAVAVEAGSAGAEVAAESGIKNLVEVDTQARALTEVSSGSSDACIIDLTMAQSMTGEGTSNSTLGYKIELGEEEYGIAFAKDSELTAKVNEIIEELKADGTLASLAQKYGVVLAG